MPKNRFRAKRTPARKIEWESRRPACSSLTTTRTWGTKEEDLVGKEIKKIFKKINWQERQEIGARRRRIRWGEIGLEFEMKGAGAD